MVSADNLNHDVLEEIFSHLPHGPNLASVALVSRSFLGAVIPRLYSIIIFRLRQAKRYPKIMSPFGAILTRPELSTYVRNVEIYSIPQLFRKNTLINNPLFIRECNRALTLCRNLIVFTITVPGSFAYFLPSILEKPRLEKLCMNANFSVTQAETLLQISNIKTLELQSGSWCVADILPKWIEASLHRSLKHLTLYLMTDLNEDVLESALTHLPELRSLHVIGCSKVDHIRLLRVVRHTPQVENISMTISENDKLITLPPSDLSHIRNLAFDVRTTENDEISSTIIKYLRTSYFPLTTFKMKFSQKEASVSFEFIELLVETHGQTLLRLAFMECQIPLKAITYICKKCPVLERLDVSLPMKELDDFARAIRHAPRLRTIVNVDNHTQHGARPYLPQEKVSILLAHSPSLRTLVDNNRVWTCDSDLHLALERKPTRKLGSPWFLPQDV